MSFLFKLTIAILIVFAILFPILISSDNKLSALFWKIAKWHLNRSQFGIRIDHDLASISDHSLASQSITIWHASDH